MSLIALRVGETIDATIGPSVDPWPASDIRPARAAWLPRIEGPVRGVRPR